MNLPPAITARLSEIDRELARLPDNEVDRRDALRAEAAALLDQIEQRQPEEPVPAIEPATAGTPGRVQVQPTDIDGWIEQADAANSRVLGIDSELRDLAALCELGNPDAIAERAGLRVEHTQLVERIAELQAAVDCGRAMLARQEAERVAVEQQAAFVEAESLLAAQSAAGAEVDAALVAAEAAWVRYLTAASDRQGAMRRAGRPIPRHVTNMGLEAALLRLAPRLSAALHVSRLPHHVRRPLAEQVR